MDNVLVAITEPGDAKILFDKVQKLIAGAPDVRLHVVQVVHEGVADIGIAAIEDSARLKSFILESAESALEDLIEPLRAAPNALEAATLWNARKWEGILHAAERAQADLIIKAAGVHHRLGDVVRTPDDWNLLRHAEVPVMLVKEEAWSPGRAVLCALDPFDEQHADLSQALLQRSAEAAAILGAELDLVCAYPLFEPWVGELGAVRSYADIKESVEQEMHDRLKTLTAEAGVSYRFAHLEEGHAAQVLLRLSEENRPTLMAVGTHSRSGVGGVLLGNTSERILHLVGCDVLTVPAPPA